MSLPSIVNPVIDKYGLINIAASMRLFTFEETPRTASEMVVRDPVIQQVTRSLEKLMSSEESFLHFWRYPNNITTDINRERLEKIVTLLTGHGTRYKTQIVRWDRLLSDSWIGKCLSDKPISYLSYINNQTNFPAYLTDWDISVHYCWCE